MGRRRLLKIRVNGIYNQATLQELSSSCGVENFGMDFRPLSNNFLPQYRFLDLISNNFNVNHNYFLHYANEKEMIIVKMLQDLKNFFIQRYGGKGEMGNIWLEFSGGSSFEEYDRFQRHYYWKYDRKCSWQAINKAKFLCGLILPFDLLSDLHYHGLFFTFVQELTDNLLLMNRPSRPMLLGLEIDWDSDLFPGLFDFLEFDFISMEINQKIEHSYRCVNQQKLQTEIKVRQHYLAQNINDFQTR